MLFGGVLIEQHTLTIQSTTTTTDDLGNSTSTDEERTATGVLFAPEGYRESTSPDSAPVLGEATLYGNTGALDADDLIEHAEPCCSGASFPHGTWQVVGGSRGWGGTNFAVPIQRVSSE